MLIDIGLAKVELRRILDALDYRNLDEVPELAGRNTTTEVMAQHIFTLLSQACRAGALGAGGAAVSAIKVLLRESPLAWATYEGSLA